MNIPVLVEYTTASEKRQPQRFCSTKSPKDTLRPAADLYRGPFLDGFYLPDSPEFDGWVGQERRRWERLVL